MLHAAYVFLYFVEYGLYFLLLCIKKRIGFSLFVKSPIHFFLYDKEPSSQIKGGGDPTMQKLIYPFVDSRSGAEQRDIQWSVESVCYTLLLVQWH